MLRPASGQPLPLVLPVPAGQVLVRQGEPAPGLWLVVAGLFSASRVDHDGRELVLDLLGPGEHVGEPADAPSPVTVRAERQGRVRPVPPPIPGTILSRRAHRAEQLASELAWGDVPARLEGRLRDLADRFGRPVPGGRSVGLRLTQYQLAAMIGASRESCTRAMRALLQRRVLRRAGPGHYVIVERPWAVRPGPVRPPDARPPDGRPPR